MMRIITGSARGTRLETLEGDMTRPTSERAKEAIFSTIQFDVEGRSVLDLFSGSGQLGLEALSRGAAHATLVDQAKIPVTIITRNAEKTHLSDRCRIVCADYAEFLRSRTNGERYDLVFLDPPYADRLIPGALCLLAEKRLLKPGAIIICEYSVDAVDEGDSALFGDSATAAEYTVVRRAKYGAAAVVLLTLANNTEEKE